ncbi:S8 family serine peptidase [Spirilliplanes yamanashiensis]|uniref:Uncharacterized protein n=1 Tax=Spirilliplanes yamanashiensis TaxID=42233 RepID=A0A8J3Y905_9ACTN|nr:S8 family serine peptidase [Spirilliplanes yamanashiensis]MDP9815959.1 subtilisin family serine protease [Spirilliplanes yamanashiensis]GIJ04216.1 hypothetical protein Sya03_35680 [Spirilliplanes yamanashiensis]
MRSITRRSLAAALGLIVTGGGVAFARSASAEQAPEPIRATGWATEAPDGPASLIVRLKDGVASTASLQRLERVADADVAERSDALDAFTVEVPAGEIDATAAALRRDPAVAYVELDHPLWASDVYPNDPEFYRQWGARTMRYPAAWEATSGSSSVTVAVIDTGVNAGPELAGAMVPGYDTYSNDSNPADTHLMEGGISHGTTVAHQIGAGGNEGIGGAGGCWTCRIMPVKVLGPGGRGSNFTVAEGIRWAVDHGADVINLSLGGPEHTDYLQEQIAYAIDRGIPVVAAAGNEGTTQRQYPAAYPGVISVAASDENERRFAFSTYGSWVTVAAPGSVQVQRSDKAWTAIYGTSFASPLVAGVVALGRSRSPEATPAQLTQALTSTTVAVPGRYVATGRVDAAAAVTALPETVSSTLSARVQSPAGSTPVRGNVGIRVVADSRIRSLAGAPGFESVAADTAAPFVLTYPSGSFSGKVTVKLLATDDAGATATVDVPLTIDNVVPVITGTSPAAKSKRRGVVTVTASGVADSGGAGIRELALYADGKYVGKDTTAPYSVKYNTGKLNKTVALQWRVFDRAGNSTTFNRAFYADNVGPSVAIKSGPKNGAKVKGTVKVVATASDKYGVDRVELVINGKKVATDKAAPHTFSINTKKYGKKIKVQVRAYDAAGNVRYATTRTWKR